MRKIALLLCMVLCFSLIGCAKNSTKNNEETEVQIIVNNTVKNRLSSIGLTYYIEDMSIGSIGVQNADGKAVDGKLSFILRRDDFPEGANLDDFTMKCSVTEIGGNTIDVCAVSFPIEFGQTYGFQLMYADENYSLWHETTPGVAWTSAGENTQDLEDTLVKYGRAVKENWDPQTCVDESVNLLIGLYQSDDKEHEIGYTFMDIDSDGTNELLIGAMPTIRDINSEMLVYEVYTMKNRQVVEVLSSAERDHYYWLGEDIFWNYGSNSAKESSETAFKYESGELIELKGKDSPAYETYINYHQLELTPFSVYIGN